MGWNFQNSQSAEDCLSIASEDSDKQLSILNYKRDHSPWASTSLVDANP